MGCWLQTGKHWIVTYCNQCKLCSSHHASASTLQRTPALPLLYFTPQCTLGGVGYRDWLAASSGRGSATAPSCVGYTCTLQHPQLTIPTTSPCFLLLAGYSC